MCLRPLKECMLLIWTSASLVVYFSHSKVEWNSRRIVDRWSDQMCRKPKVDFSRPSVRIGWRRLWAYGQPRLIAAVGPFSCVLFYGWRHVSTANGQHATSVVLIQLDDCSPLMRLNSAVLSLCQPTRTLLSTSSTATTISSSFSSLKW